MQWHSNRLWKRTVGFRITLTSQSPQLSCWMECGLQRERWLNLFMKKRSQDDLFLNPSTLTIIEQQLLGITLKNTWMSLCMMKEIPVDCTTLLDYSWLPGSDMHWLKEGPQPSSIVFKDHPSWTLLFFVSRQLKKKYPEATTSRHLGSCLRSSA